MGKNLKGLFCLMLHVGAETLFLVVWAMAAFLVDHVLLTHFPLERSSAMTFRGFELLFYLSTFRRVFHALFRRNRQRNRRRKRFFGQLRRIFRLVLTLYLLGPREQEDATRRATGKLASRVTAKKLTK